MDITPRNNPVLSVKFKRTANMDDIKYRCRQIDDFANHLRAVLPEDSNLCFHGTSIWNTQLIIDSGNISSAVDRENRNLSIFDTPGQVDITTRNNIDITIKGYSWLGDFDYPAGCIFVILPQKAEDIESSRLNYIGNIVLRETPERLEAIITTPENIDRVSNWLKNSNLDICSSKVMDYDNFINIMRNQKVLSNN